MLEKYDISHQLVEAARVNLAVKQIEPVQWEGKRCLQGQIYDNGFLDSAFMFGKPIRANDSAILNTTVIFQVPESDLSRLSQVETVYLHQAKVVSLAPQVVTCDTASLCIPGEHCRATASGQQVWHLSQYAGGYGGWQYGMQFLARHGLRVPQTIAIDDSLEAVVQYGLNHEFQILGDLSLLDSSFFEQHPQSTIVQSEIRNLQWQQAVQFLDFNLWTISAPCVSWSLAGNQRGFGTLDGMCLAESLAQGRIFRPPLLGIEQVSGFPSHAHFTIFLNLLRWAGYEIILADTLEMSHVTPPRRARWLCICVLQGTLYEPVPRFQWPRGTQGAYQFDALQQLTGPELRAFQPSQATAAIYFAPENMPGSCKNLEKSTIIRYRLPNLWGSLPTFMAMYSEQHLLAPEQRGEKGLFGFFAKQGTSFRFFTPAEVCMLHGQPSALLLLKPKAISYRHLGNMITPLHAIAVLLPAFQMLGCIDSDLQFQDLCQEFLAHRLRMSQCEVDQDSCAWYIGTTAEIQQQKARVQFFLEQMGWEISQTNHWPTGAFFHPLEGLVRLTGSQPVSLDEFSLSQNAPIDFKFFVLLVPSQYGLYKCDAMLSWGDLLSVWDFRVFPGHLTVDPQTLTDNILDTTPTLEQTLMILNNDQQQQMQESHPKALQLTAIRDNTDLSLYAPDTQQNWRDYCKKCFLPDQLYYDSFGVIEPTDEQWIGEIASQWIEPEPIPNIAGVLAEAVLVNIQAKVPMHTDILVLDCKGPQEAQLAFLRLWNSPQLQAWLRTKGRQINMEQIEDGHWALLFRPHLPQTATPVQFLQEELFIRLLKIVLASIQVEEGHSCIFQYDQGPNSRTLHQGFIPEHLETSFLAMLIQYLGQVFLAPVSKILTASDSVPISEHQPVSRYPPSSTFRVQSAQEVGVASSVLPTNPTYDELPYNLASARTYVGFDQYEKVAKVAMHADPAILLLCREIWAELTATGFFRDHGHQVHLHMQEHRLLFTVTDFDENAPGTDDFREALFWQLVQLTFQKYQGGRGTTMTLKYEGCPPFELHHNYPTMKYVFDVLHLWYHWLMPNRPASMNPRLVYRGKQLMPETSMESLKIEMTLNPRSKVNVIDPCHGGGPVRPPSSKQDHHKLVESGLASMLLDHQVQLPQIPVIVSTLMQHEGLQKLHHMLGQTDSTAKRTQFQQLCQKHGVALPQDGAQLSKTQGKYQRIRENNYQRQMVNPDPSMFQLKPGFFVNSDGSPAQILNQFSMQSCGVLLAQGEQVTEWLRVTSGKATDELAIYVLGTYSAPEGYSPTNIHAPAIDSHGREVLLNGVLLQLGHKHITIAKQGEDTYTTEAVQIASVTCWKADYDAATWESIIKTPVKAIQGILATEGFHGSMCKPWGRVYQDSGVTVKPEYASSVQFHATFLADQKFASLLRRSGFCKVFLCPKTESGQPDSRWKVIWLPSEMSILEAESKAAGLAGAAGLVRTRRGLGLRVEAGNYAAAWQVFKPQQPLPDQTEKKMLFKLHPLPLGVSADTLRQWAMECYNWSIKPVRAVGAKQWLVGSDTVPTEILLFNGNALLLQQIPMRGVKQASSIVAGPRQLPKQPKVNATPGPALAAYRTGDPHYDPWRPYASSNTTAQTSDAASVKTTSSTEPRQVAGPVAQRLDQQDARLQAIETAMVNIRDEHQQKQKQTDQFQTNMQTQLQSHIDQTAKAFEFMNEEHRILQRTVSTAMEKQENKLCTSFEELKRLVIESSRGTKRVAEDDLDSDLESLAKMNE